MWLVGICSACRAVVAIKKPMSHIRHIYGKKGEYPCPVCLDGKLTDLRHSQGASLDRHYTELRAVHTSLGGKWEGD